MNYLNPPYAKQIVLNALKEDIGKGDITTNLLIPLGAQAEAVILAKENFVACGLNFARLAFKLADKNIKFKALVKEGDYVKKGKVIARIRGKAGCILTAERTALNFLGLLCAIATKTKQFTDAVKPYRVKITDTRKTLPGLRPLEKYAVRVGGGFNHRMNLSEMVMVKDNHLKLVSGLSSLKGKLLRLQRRGCPIEIEVENLKQFKQALVLRPDIIMLDNMGIKDIKKAVKIRNQVPTKLEASGGININNIKKIASTGVDFISLGTITHSVNSADISLEIL